MSTSYLDALLERVGAHDSTLASDLRAHLRARLGGREYGLVFDRHVPETVELPGRTVRTGDKVRRLDDDEQKTFVVAGVRKDGNQRVADLIAVGDPGTGLAITTSDLMVVADFRDPIYPGLKSTGRLDRGGDKPFHAVIKAENYHALEALRFACSGRVDCIYIDPPYNTRDKDWKYNNDYVDPADEYAHSMWLSFMERRLRLAKELLNPDRSALIVSIDEKEHLRLGLLLEQLFPEATMQMVSTVINPKGTGRTNEFRRIDEYLFFLWFGTATLGYLPETSAPSDDEAGTESDTDTDETTAVEIDPGGEDSAAEEPADQAAGESESDPLDLGQGVDWQTFRRRDIASARGTKKGGPAQFYPIYVDKRSGQIADIGEPLAHGVARTKAPARRGCVAVFPIRPDGTEMNWAVTVPTAIERWKNGYVRAGKAKPHEPQQYIIQYLKSGPIKDIEEGRAVVAGHAEDGSVLAYYPSSKPKGPTTQWRLRSHNAEHYGTRLLQALVPGRQFPFPKSLYAVEDALRLFVEEIPDALIVDFFGGSGTTAHAVMRLNKQDGGRRRCILITNNEVSSDEAAGLRAQGNRPGDLPWEALGICEHITRPRLEAAVTGRTAQDEPVAGNYKFVDNFPMSEGFEENVEFFDLTYEDAEHVRLDMAFEAVAPMLWLRAGAVGQRIDARNESFSVADRYGILFNPDDWKAFTNALAAVDDLACVFVVTDSDSVYQAVATKLPAGVEKVRLYESYLQSFEINTGKE